MYRLHVLLLVSLVSTVSARTWREGDNGWVRWDLDCDFVGNDIGTKSGTADKCGGMCLDNSSCSHFTHNGGTCYLKDYPGDDFREVNHKGNICGWVIGRSGQTE